MKKNTLLIFLIIILGCSMVFFGCSKPEESTTEETETSSGAEETQTETEMPSYTLRIAMICPDDNPRPLSLNAVFKPYVEEHTNGKVTVELYPNSQLGSDMESIEATMLGNLEMVAPSTSSLSSFDERFFILDLPYLFTSLDAARAAFAGDFGADLNKWLEENNLVALYWGDSGFRGLTNNTHSVYSPDDLAGMKIRVMENTYHLAAFKAWGANPTPMAFSELFTALEQGTVDGQDNGVLITYEDNLHTVQKYMTLSDHILSGNCVLINKGLFYDMPQEYQDIIRTAAAMTIERQCELTDETFVEALQGIKDAGLTVNELTKEQKEVFKEKASDAYDIYTEKYGSDLVDIANSYN